MSKKVQLQKLTQILNYVLALPIIFVVIYFLLKDVESIKNFSIEFVAIGLGVIIAFILERQASLKNEISLSEKIVKNLINEIQINKTILNNVKRMDNEIKKGYYFQLHTTVWDMHKESLIFDDVNTYFDVAKLYHSFIELNGSINNSGNIFDAQKRMGEYSTNLFNRIVEQIDTVLGLLINTEK